MTCSIFGFIFWQIYIKNRTTIDTWKPLSKTPCIWETCVKPTHAAHTHLSCIFESYAFFRFCSHSISQICIQCLSSLSLSLYGLCTCDEFGMCDCVRCVLKVKQLLTHKLILLSDFWQFNTSSTAKCQTVYDFDCECSLQTLANDSYGKTMIIYRW